METIARKNYIWFIIVTTCLVLALCGAVLSVWHVYITTRDAHIAKQELATYTQNKEVFQKEYEMAVALAERVAILEGQMGAVRTDESVAGAIRSLFSQAGVVGTVSTDGAGQYTVSFSGSEQDVLATLAHVEKIVRGGTHTVGLTFIEGQWQAVLGFGV